MKEGLSAAFAPEQAADRLLVDHRHIPFTLDQGIAHRAAIGLIVLATDHTIEHEWRMMLSGIEGVAFYESRLWNAASITPETLREMERGIAYATKLIRPGERIDVMAFACTSGALVIGDDNVAARIHEERPDVPTTAPLAAAVAAFKAMGTHRVALLTPYVDRINRMMRDYMLTRGLEVPVMGSFNHENDNEVARIDAQSIQAAVMDLGAVAAVEAVFVSCTSLRVASLVEKLEAQLGKPVTSSNHALAWHSLRLAGFSDPIDSFGLLMRTQAASAAQSTVRQR
jgi:maleate isomerase